MIRFYKSHPLTTILLIALAVRLMAVVFSAGFIHSDDYYDTVEISYDWLQDGLWGEDGHLRWKDHPADTIVRFPLYTLFLYLIMKLYQVFGITALGTMMYGIRLVHALISLLPVWVVFRVMQKVSGKNDWAALGGLMVGLHFAMPFLGVRSLIEMVGGNLWIVAIYYLYRFGDKSESRWLYLAGLMTGLAWMIRFQLAFAVLPIPLILWYEYRRLRPAVHYCLAVAVMLLISAVADIPLIGYFAGSTINNLALNTGQGALYYTIPLLYPLVILAFFIPPLSLVLAYLSGRIGFWREHRLLVISTLVFILAHMFHSNQQERFMMPVVPALFLVAVLALWYKYCERGYILKNRRLMTAVVGITLAVNFILLPVFTTAYGHKGLIEPLIWIEKMEVKPRVMVIQPDMKRWIPINYAGYDPPIRQYIRQWDDFDIIKPEFRERDAFDLFIFYPQREEDMVVYLDSIQARYRSLEPVRQFESSLYDRIMNRLNPRHYQKFDARVYRPKGN